MERLPLLRASAKSLVRRPGYSLLVTATLAVGIGGATSIFSLVDGVLLRALPFGDGDRIVAIEATDADTGYGISLSIPNYRDWAERNRAFDRFGASAGWGFVRATPEGAERVDARTVLGDFFGTLGVEAELGRLIPPDDTGPGATPVAVLGHGFWERAYGADPTVLGRSLVLDDRPYAIVGVLPAGVGYPRPAVEVYVPMGVLAADLPWDVRDSSFGSTALARLAPGSTIEAAQRDMNRVTAEVDALEGKPVVTAEVLPLRDRLLGGVERGLWLLMGAVGFLLLVAGANVANLALARGEARGSELAVRRALGAGSGDLVLLLLAESAWLSAAGGGAGVALAVAGADVLPRLLPLRIPSLMAAGIGVHAPVLAFALALTVLSGALFALVPALRASRSVGDLRHGRRTTGGREGRRMRDALVVVQVALSLVLLVGSGLLLRSLHNMASVDKGFVDEGVVAARLSQPRSAFASTADWLSFYDELVGRLDASPEVERTALSLLVPLSDRSWERRVIPEDAPFDPDAAPSVLFNVVSRDYFDVMGIPLERGRAFTIADDAHAPPAVVIDETMAARFWPDQDPIGRRITLMEPVGDEDAPDAPGEVVWRTVVGVVPNVRHYELTSVSRVQAYVPMRQAFRTSGVSLTVLARARDGTGTLPGLVRRTVADLRPDIPIADLGPLSGYVDDKLGPSRALGATTSLFAVVALLLAALGIFGVLSLAVARRAPEIGVRMAVGASPGDVLGMVVARGVALTAAGIGVGMVGAALAGRTLEAFLYDVGAWDGRVYGAVAAILSAVAVLAAMAPALRAARTSPVEVLREE
jgi:predicted permease